METRLRSSLAAAASVRSGKHEGSPVRTPRKSVRSRTPQIPDKDALVSGEVAKSAKYDLSESITQRRPRTRRLSNMSSDASPARVTRSTKSLVPQETLRELEFGDSSDTQTSSKNHGEKGPSPLLGSPRARQVSSKSSGDKRTITVNSDSTEDEFVGQSANASSKIKDGQKSAQKEVPSSSRIRRISDKLTDGKKSVSGMTSKENSSKELSPKKSNTGNSPEKTTPGSPRTRRVSEKFKDVEISSKLIMDLSEDESVEPTSTNPSIIGTLRKSPESPILGSPRPRRLSEKSGGKLAEDVLSRTQANELSPASSVKGRKSIERSSQGSPRARKLSEKSTEQEVSDTLIMAVSSEDESNVSLTMASSKKDKTNKSVVKSPSGSPLMRKPVGKSPELRAGKLIMEVSSEEELESSLISSNKSQPRKLETPRPRKLSGSYVESEISNSSMKKLSASVSKDSPVSSSVQKKNRRRTSLESLSRSRKLSDKSTNGSKADDDMLKLELSAGSNAMDVSFSSREEASPGKKVRDWQVSDLSASIADVSLDSVNVKAKSKKQRKRSKGSIRVSPERQADDVRTKDNSSKTADSDVTVRRRGGGTIIESRPVFSDDAKYVYLNCGWGVRVFSVETGECVRVFDAFSKDFKVVDCFCWNTLPAALTSEGVFIAWDPRSGKIQQKVRMHVKTTEVVIGGFFIPCEDAPPLLCLVLESKEYTTLRIYSGSNFRSLAGHPLSTRKIAHPYKQHSLSVGGDPKHPFIAYIDNRKGIRVVNMQNKTFFRNSNPPDKYWTCIRAHPTEDTLAAGDSIGRIVVFRNLNSSHPVKNCSVNSVYHWHTLPVCEIAFTPAGSSMYSGGGELTLVKWNVENPQVRHFLPRMSADIVHIAISPYNQMVAVATLDNGVQIVTPTNKLQCILQQFSWSVIATEQERMFPSGLLYDPRSRGLILNSRPGHLQLYSPHSETLTYNIDVTMMNYLTQERDKVIVNTQVTHSALTSDGLWLATVETRYEPGLTLELRLKFWNYSSEKKRFILATVIDMPHDDQVHTIKFSPEPSKRMSNESVQPESEVVLVSTGADRKMRLWSKVPVDSIYQKGETWRCQNACFYRDQPCGPCSFSYDGSVLAVGFGAALTLWDVENVVLKHSLARSNEHIKFVEFGRDECCNMLMCATESVVMAWDLLKLALSWRVDLKSAIFVADPYSSFVTVFTVDNQWKILDAHNGDIVSTMNSDGKSEVSDRPQKQQVLAAVFVPRHRPNTEAPKWMRNSYLYYIDVYQELNCLEPANESSQLPKFQLALDKDSGTLFGSLVGAKSVREKADEEHSKTVGYGVLGARAITQLLGSAAHTLPPVNLLCGSFLQSFVILKRDNLPDESDRDDKSEDDKTTVIASSDSEQEVEMPTFSAPTSRPKKSAKKPDRRPQSATPSESTPEPMDTDTDLSKHFPMLDEDGEEPWRRRLQEEKDPSQTFIIDE